MSYFSLSASSSEFDSGSHRSRQWARKRRGASVLVETALCLTLVLLPLSLVTIQFGVVMATGNQVEQVSRESARWASVHCLEKTFDNDENQSNPPSFKFYVKNVIVKNKISLSWSDLDGLQTGDGYVQVTPNTLAGRLSGQPLTVSVTYPMERKIFLIGSTTFGNGNPKLGPSDNIKARIGRPYTAASTYVIE